MPWTPTDVVELRYQMIQLHLRGECSKAELARRFNVSEKTVYKWIARFHADGRKGLADQSRAPHSHPHAIAPKIVKKILHLKAKHPDWGAPKIRVLLARELAATQATQTLPVPSETSVGNILHHYGLTQPPKRKRRTAFTPSDALRTAEYPNAIWSTDFKGDFLMGDARKCIPLTIADYSSRYLLCCQSLYETKLPVVKPFFERCFERYGLPEVIRSDNGPPFATRALGGLSELTVWWIKLGIVPERIAPGRPQQNGRHERMHRTLKQSAISPAAASLVSQQAAFDQFRESYNEERPHEGLGMKTPASCFETSPREYDRSLAQRPANYPSQWSRVRVNANGQVRYQGRQIYLANCLKGEEIGICWRDDGVWDLYLMGHRLGRYDVRSRQLDPIQRLSQPLVFDGG